MTVSILHFADGQFPGGTSTTLVPLAVTFDDPLEDLGNASVTLRASDPDAANIAPEDVLSFYLVADDLSLVWCGDMIVDDDLLIEIDPNEEIGQTVTYTGELMMLELKDGLIEPPGGTGRFPIVEDLVYDFTHPDFDDTQPGWVNATQIATVAAVSIPNVWTGPGNNGWVDTLGNHVMPDGSPTYLLWASDGTLTSAGVGMAPMREKFTTSFDGAHYVLVSGDNNVRVWIDGKEVSTTSLDVEGGLVGYTTRNAQLFSLSAGEHTIALLGENYEAFGSPNPAAVAAQVWIPGPPGLEFKSVLVWETTASVRMVEYPSEIPGMTPGNDVRLWLESQQALGRFTDWTLDCTDTQTSIPPGAVDPEDWNVTPTVSVRVGEDDGLSLALKIMEGYADVRIGPGKVIHMYNKGAFTQSSGVTFEVGNLTSLHHHRVRLTGDEGLAKSKLGWTRVGSGGRREVFIPFGPENNPAEIARLGTQALSVSSVAPEERSFTYKARNDTEKPYINAAFVPGSTGVVPVRGGGTANDRIMHVGFSWSKDAGEELVVVVTAKNIILQEQERITRTLKALGA